MVSPQPVQLWRYLGVKRNKLNNNLKRLFYLSWEDAFWDLLDNKNIKKNSTILVPEFFCGDVENNMKSHGYKVEHYKIKENINADMGNFQKSLKVFKPSVVIVFHPVGIKSNININLINKNVIVIEDCVHQIIDLNNIKINRKNHFVIDSLRKVVPLQGSNLIGRSRDLCFNEPLIYQSFFYSFRVHILWLFMILGWNLKFYNFAERMMIYGYNLIGDYKLSAKGFWLFSYLFQFVDYKKIKEVKTNQVRIYQKHIKTNIKFRKSDIGNLRGYPVIVNIKILDFLRNNNLFVRFELNDSIWCKNRKIIYLPLGPHITHDKILKICEIYQSASSTQGLVA